MKQNIRSMIAMTLATSLFAMSPMTAMAQEAVPSKPYQIQILKEDIQQKMHEEKLLTTKADIIGNYAKGKGLPLFLRSETANAIAGGLVSGIITGLVVNRALRNYYERPIGVAIYSALAALVGGIVVGVAEDHFNGDQFAFADEVSQLDADTLNYRYNADMREISDLANQIQQDAAQLKALGVDPATVK